MKRKFKLGAVLSVTNSRLLCDIGDVYEILNFMGSDQLFTHQLPRAARSAKPWILKQHPALESVSDTHVTTENWRQHLADQEAIFGKELELEPIPLDSDSYEHKDPIAELVDMVGPEKVIVARLNEEG